MEHQLTVLTAAAIQWYLGFSQRLSSLAMVLIIGAQEPIIANKILTTSHPRLTCVREAALLQLGLPNGPVRLWTDSIPCKSPVL